MKLSSQNLLPLLVSRVLAESQWEKLFTAAFRGELKPAEIKALLLLIAKKGEDTPEVWGSLKAIRRIETPRRVNLPLMDVCGTGGDGLQTFNISTVSSFVIAGAGGYVAKHGNRAVSSQVGSSDLMEALGVFIDAAYPTMLQALRECRLGYFHAPHYHPSFCHVQPIRRELGIRTIFNLLGPLLNPLELHYQVVGISNPRWLVPASQALKRLGRIRAAAIHSEGGLDELSTYRPNDILYLEHGRVRKARLDPKRFGFSKVRKDDYAGGNLRTNREIALGILENRIRGPKQEIVCLNSGFALWVSGIAASVEEGVEKSRWTIRTGSARAVLDGLRKITNRRGKK